MARRTLALLLLPALLAACYRNCLALAASQGLQSIAFPAISCGAYGFPIPLACTIAIGEVRKL